MKQAGKVRVEIEAGSESLAFFELSALQRIKDLEEHQERHQPPTQKSFWQMLGAVAHSFKRPDPVFTGEIRRPKIDRFFL